MADDDERMLFGPTMHVLHVTLLDVEPLVWRRMVVRSDMTLARLSRALERAMGWRGSHLHLFDVNGILFGASDEDADHLIDERAASVRHVLPRVGASMRWNYDVGDGWEHEVLAESIVPQEDGWIQPVCLDGANACPPENCGGPPGYGRLLAALADPADSEHDEFAPWAPKGFDPAAFDIAAANRRLQSR